MNIGWIAPLLAAFLFWSESLTSVTTSEVSLRCMIQMVNYDGEGAYVIVGLVDSEGKYLDTLYVLGDDEDWYYELEEWWKFFGRSRTPLMESRALPLAEVSEPFCSLI